MCQILYLKLKNNVPKWLKKVLQWQREWPILVLWHHLRFCQEGSASVGGGGWRLMGTRDHMVPLHYLTKMVGVVLPFKI